MSNISERNFDKLESLCIELSNHSKETFWIGQHDTPTCELEYFAKSIFEKYTVGLVKEKDTKEFEKNGTKLEFLKEGKNKLIFTFFQYRNRIIY